MTQGFLATKVGMTQVFIDEGVRVPVTVLKVEPNFVVQKRTNDVDGYTAVQIGYGSIREKLVNKPKAGHFKKAGLEPMRHLREFRIDEDELEAFEVGQQVDLASFSEMKSFDATATSKGKGFAGVMKRHNFKGFRATHGTHEYFRHGGSIGCRAKPGKVFKGKKMAGQMGNERVTTINLRVVDFDTENGILLLRGAVPGGKNALVELKPSARMARTILGIGGVQEAQRSKNPMKASKAGR